MIDVERDPIYLTAADWFARLREPEVSLEDMMAWQQWIGESERHAQAFAQVEQVSAVLRLAKRPSLPPLSQDAQDRYDASTPLSAWRAPFYSRHKFALAASVVFAAVVGGWMLSQRESTEVLQTAVGENRAVKLADGSAVVLGGDTRVEVALGRKLRRLELVQGEAFFTVAKDPLRPFKVRAGDATVVAVGTAFNVRHGADRTVVDVLEGRVIVEGATASAPLSLLAGSRGPAPVSLISGEQTTISSAGIAAPAPAADPGAATAWQTGRLAFELETLDHVLEVVNRYAPKPIAAADRSVGSLRITATVVAGNVDGLVASMEKAFGLEAVEESDRILLRPKQLR